MNARATQSFLPKGIQALGPVGWSLELLGKQIQYSIRQTEPRVAGCDLTKKLSWGGEIMGNGNKVVRIAALVAAVCAGGFNVQAKGKTTQAPERVSGEIIVKLKDAPSGIRSATAVRALHSSLSRFNVQSIDLFKTDASLAQVKIASDAQVTDAISALNSNPNVEYAEPNYVLHHFGETYDETKPNDVEFDKLWGMLNVGQVDPGTKGGTAGVAGADINVMPLWAKGITGSKSMVIAIIDTGVNYKHADLAANVFTNPGESGDGKETNGVDDDGNGFIDDVHGWDFANRKANGLDDHGHGSHCAGTIGGAGNNGLGVTGVNWAISILPVKFLSKTGGGSAAGAIESINYARLMKVKIMSNSWGGGGYSKALEDAIKATKDAGILFVAAAGNDSKNNDGSPTYPATYNVDNIVSVAAIDNRSRIAKFSSFGAKTVHVSAPGVNILSSTLEDKYEVYSGTSMATPHVTGAAALLWSANPNLTYAEIKDRLIKTSQPVYGLASRSVSQGRINMVNLFDNVVPTPLPMPDAAKWVDQAASAESAHPYTNGLDTTVTLKAEGAKFIRVVFEKVELERNYDFVKLEDAKGEVYGQLTGSGTNVMSDWVVGDTVVLRLTTDESGVGYGFKVAKIQVQ